jgi:7-cyano-7-deazaguanine synthase
MRKAIVLLSGGIDSATTLYIAKKRGYKCSCLIFDYGQKNKKEIDAARKVAKKAGCGFQIIKFRLPWGGSSLLHGRLTIPQNKRFCIRNIPSTYVPARNTIFLSFALSFAEAKKAPAVFIGAHTQDYSGYPDCRPGYFQAVSRVARLGTKAGIKGEGIKIFTPLLYKTKTEIIKIGLKLGTPYKSTWSCYKGRSRPCGRCDSCLFRARGFRRAGIKDPIYARG